eukprot:TRINITY_DN4380_c0_g1_i1.p1 TRINITY_DN4380_c0_g1~~TRINITY_DN4380_c0_g1_i1.p1  ORF type:complete len:927 (-),score=94.99 TRINITY_DN4380_c0_g1_i1:8-2743(-)
MAGPEAAVSFERPFLSVTATERPRTHNPHAVVRTFDGYWFVVLRTAPNRRGTRDSATGSSSGGEDASLERDSARTGRQYKILRIHPTSGAFLPLTGIGGEVLVFPCLDEAFRAIQQEDRRPDHVDPSIRFPFVHRFQTVVGALVLDMLYILVINETEAAIALPRNRTVFRVAESEWIRVPLRVRQPAMTRSEREALDTLINTNLKENYFFCAHADLTTPFPHCLTRPPTAALEDYDWNKRLREPFEAADVGNVCCVLLCGLAISMVVPQTTGPDLHVGMISRKNNRNPGPRYLGRGLNDRAGAGNEFESELFLWVENPDEDGLSARWSRYLWRRGTVPLHWKSVINNYVSEADIIMEPDAYRNVDTYFDALYSHLSETVRMDAACTTAPAAAFECNLMLLNLLRASKHYGEDLLSDRYEQCASYLRTKYEHEGSGRAIRTHLEYRQFDWHQSVKGLGIECTVALLWDLVGLGTSADPAGLTSNGELRFTGSLLSVGCAAVQQRFLRVNCADSLDRTNLACFFTCLKVILHQTANVSAIVAAPPLSESTPPPNFGRFFSRLAAFTGGELPAPASPRGASSRSRSALVFADTDLSTEDHTEQERNTPPGFSYLRETYPQRLLTVLATMFVANGDTIATLYTGSAALHTGIIRNLVPSLKPARPNHLISLQRRYENVFEDKRRQIQYELLLGRNLVHRFPSLQGCFSVLKLMPEQWNRAVVIEGIGRDISESEAQALISSWEGIEDVTYGLDWRDEGCLVETPSLSPTSPLSPASTPETSAEITPLTLAVVLFTGEINASRVLHLAGAGFVLSPQRELVAPYQYPVENSDLSAPPSPSADYLLKATKTTLEIGQKACDKAVVFGMTARDRTAVLREKSAERAGQGIAFAKDKVKIFGRAVGKWMVAQPARESPS